MGLVTIGVTGARRLVTADLGAGRLVVFTERTAGCGAPARLVLLVLLVADDDATAAFLIIPLSFGGGPAILSLTLRTLPVPIGGSVRQHKGKVRSGSKNLSFSFRNVS